MGETTEVEACPGEEEERALLILTHLDTLVFVVVVSTSDVTSHLHSSCRAGEGGGGGECGEGHIDILTKL